MHRTRVLLTAALLVAGSFHIAAAQTSTTAPAATTAPAKTDAKTDAKPSRMHLTMQRLKEMRATWLANKPKYKACRTQVKRQGLTGDDRWFFIQDCMNKT
ncbi:MAG: hypothetical protein JO141_18885 [Bradyrhizobium sp.]|nr:hypothetical protein [Bradyrhizobium sp.]